MKLNTDSTFIWSLQIESDTVHEYNLSPDEQFIYVLGGSAVVQINSSDGIIMNSVGYVGCKWTSATQI